MSEEQKSRAERREEKRLMDKIEKKDLPDDVKEFIAIIEQNHTRAMKVFEEMKNILADLGFTITAYLDSKPYGIFPKAGMTAMSVNEWKEYNEFKKSKLECGCFKECKGHEPEPCGPEEPEPDGKPEENKPENPDEQS